MAINRNLDTDGKLEVLSASVQWLQYGLTALVVALVFALGGLFNTYLAEKQASYLDLRDEVQEQNARIDTLIYEIRQQKTEVSQPTP